MRQNLLTGRIVQNVIDIIILSSSPTITSNTFIRAFCNHCKGAGRIEALIRSFELDNNAVLIS